MKIDGGKTISLKIKTDAKLGTSSIEIEALVLKNKLVSLSSFTVIGTEPRFRQVPLSLNFYDR
jgi:hypothetical protein